MLSSVRRPTERASSRFATLAQTMNNTSTEIAIRISSGRSSSSGAALCDSQTRRMVALTPRLVSGAISSRWRANVAASARACSLATPGFKRTNPYKHLYSRLRNADPSSRPSSLAMVTGTQISKKSPGIVPGNSGGATPTTVNSRRLTRRVLPIALASPWKRLRHSRWLITATAYPPVLSPFSSGVNMRPSTGFTPSTAK